MWRVALFSWLLIAALRIEAQSPAPEDLLQKGLSAYQNQRFDEARDSFEQLLRARGNDPHVLHNLALTYAQLEQKPMALALWRKALSIDPSYRPAKSGREYLERHSNMRPFERDSLSLWLRETLAELSLFEIAWFVALLIGGSGFFGIRYFAERMTAVDEEKAMPSFPGPALLLSFLLIGALVLAGLKLNHELQERGTVVVAKASARSLPSDEGVSVYDVNGGSELLIRRKSSGWVQVQSSEGTSGWLRDSEIMITSGWSASL